jgi:membrane-bound inhibitor of C-type lysozyme
MNNNPNAITKKRDAVTALMFGEIDNLLDKAEKLTGTIDAASENLRVTINRLETASDEYHQAVLTANLRSKNEMITYLQNITSISVAKTADEQREIVQKLIREAVSKEVITLKKVLSESSANYHGSFIDRWAKTLLCCLFTSLIGSVITVELLRRLWIH